MPDAADDGRAMGRVEEEEDGRVEVLRARTCQRASERRRRRA
jgi:hypothetical protein